MKMIEIIENTSYTLSEQYIDEIQQLLIENPTLPFTLNHHTLTFDKYIIGSIQIKDLLIVIQPRIKNLAANHYLEMQLYNEGLLDKRISSLLDENQSYGFQDSIISLFLKETFELVSKGLEGDFIMIQEETSYIKGKILVEEISPVNLLMDKVPVEYEMHTLQTSYNKLIKLALDKVRVITQKQSYVKIYSLINSFFDNIQADYMELLDYLSGVDQKLHFINQHYFIVLALAKKILIDLKINLKNNKVSSASYLVNSNTIFEKYARKVLVDNFKVPVSKWNQPRIMGKYTINGMQFNKSYIPDILIDYRHNENSAYAVLDAKNKDISNANNIGEVADIYQLLFYCNTLSAGYGVLIYPYAGGMDVIRLNILSFKETNLFAIAIDFSLPIKERHSKYLEQVSSTLMVR